MKLFGIHSKGNEVFRWEGKIPQTHSEMGSLAAVRRIRRKQRKQKQGGQVIAAVQERVTAIFEKYGDKGLAKPANHMG